MTLTRALSVPCAWVTTLSTTLMIDGVLYSRFAKVLQLRRAFLAEMHLPGGSLHPARRADGVTSHRVAASPAAASPAAVGAPSCADASCDSKGAATASCGSNVAAVDDHGGASGMRDS